MFSSRAKYFELVLSACSKREEDEWTRLLEEQIEASDAEPIPSGRNQQTQLYFNIEPLQATVINGRLLSIARRTSIHGPLVAVPDLNGLRIYIKGTAAFHVAPLPIAPPINRTQSLQNPRREIVVEAKRQKRIKMEKRLKEVWSHDILPYPGLVPESFVRASTDVLLGTFSNLPAFARRTSNREDKERKNSERFTLAKESSTDEGIKAADETVVPLGMEGYPDEAADKFDTHGDLSRALSNQRRGLLSLRKRSYNLLKLTNGEAESKSPSKVDRPSLRKRLSVALFNRVASPGKPRRFNSVEA